MWKGDVHKPTGLGVTLATKTVVTDRWMCGFSDALGKRGLMKLEAWMDPVWGLIQPWEGEERGRGWAELSQAADPPPGSAQPISCLFLPRGSSCINVHPRVQVRDTGYYLIPPFHPHSWLQPCPSGGPEGAVHGLCYSTDFFQVWAQPQQGGREERKDLLRWSKARECPRAGGDRSSLLACSAIPRRWLESRQLNQQGCVGENPRDGVWGWFIK